MAARSRATTASRSRSSEGGLREAITGVVDALPLRSLAQRLSSLEKTLSSLEREVRRVVGGAGRAGGAKRTTSRGAAAGAAKRTTSRSKTTTGAKATTRRPAAATAGGEKAATRRGARASTRTAAGGARGRSRSVRGGGSGVAGGDTQQMGLPSAPSTADSRTEELRALLEENDRSRDRASLFEREDEDELSSQELATTSFPAPGPPLAP